MRGGQLGEWSVHIASSPFKLHMHPLRDLLGTDVSASAGQQILLLCVRARDLRLCSSMWKKYTV